LYCTIVHVHTVRCLYVVCYMCVYDCVCYYRALSSLLVFLVEYTPILQFKVSGITSMLRGNIFDSLPFPTDQNGFHYFCSH